MSKNRIKITKVPKGPRHTEAPEEVLELMARIVDENHGELAEAPISVWMVNGGWSAGGEAVECDVQVITGVARKECGYVFRVLINAKTWETASADYRKYLLDNALCRCGKSETGSGEARWYKRPFAVQAFPEIVRRHGLISEPLKNFDRAMRQQELDFDGAAPQEQMQVQ